MTTLLAVLLLPGFVHAAVLTPSQTECLRFLETVLTAPHDLAQSSDSFSTRHRHPRKKIVVGEEGSRSWTLESFELDREDENDESSSVSVERLKEVWTVLLDHPTAGLCHLADHDPTGEIGFCFGRGMAAHLEALVAGTHLGHVRKVFIEGRFENPVEGEAVWFYHVATVVRAQGGVWYAIDPRLDGPVPITRWGAHWAAFAVGEYKFLVHDADVLWPTGTSYAAYFRAAAERPSREGTRGAVVHKYMTALARDYRALLRALAEEKAVPHPSAADRVPDVASIRY